MYMMFKAFYIILLLVQNFYMSLFFQEYRRTYAIAMLIGMFFSNSLMVFGVYIFGQTLISQLALYQVFALSACIVAVMQYIWWRMLGLTSELKGVLLAQLCVCATLLVSYTLYYLVN